MPETFNSYEEALDLIGRSEFQIHKEISQLNSSWVQKLEYFSCNKTDGFLITTTNGKRFVHQKVPYSVWQALENSESKGGFYNAVLKKEVCAKN
ncbi:MAG: KTSC domain-containing protein [Lewinellaceae bacterium]|nr:KTSC domain-containing protein [Lewinellaceae bacterium]